MSFKGQDYSLTLVKGHSDFKVKTCFSQKQLDDLVPKLIWKLKGEWEWKFIQMSWVTWPTWPPYPYMVKIFKKSFSLEPINRWPWNLIYMTLSMQVLPRFFTLWPWVDSDLFYATVKFGHISFCIGKVKIIIFWKLLESLVPELPEAFN